MRFVAQPAHQPAKVKPVPKCVVAPALGTGQGRALVLGLLLYSHADQNQQDGAHQCYRGKDGAQDRKQLVAAPLAESCDAQAEAGSKRPD